MAMPCFGISKKVTTSLPSSAADVDDTIPAASSAAMLSTVTDKKLLFARPPVLGALWGRENWFLASPSTPNSGRAGPGCQRGGFARFQTGLGAARRFLPPGRSFWAVRPASNLGRISEG